MKHTIYALTMFALAACTSPKEKAIDRHALVTRNNPEVTAMDSLSSLSVGNGEFAYTVDATGLQTFPEVYKNGVPLGTQSQWGWHSFGNPENYKPEEAWWSMTSATAQRAICHPTQRTRQSKGSIRLVSCKPTPPASGYHRTRIRK